MTELNIDPRITELLDLAREEGLPLALRPETVCALEDTGWLVDPFTGQLWRDPAAKVGMSVYIIDLEAPMLPWEVFPARVTT